MDSHGMSSPPEVPKSLPPHCRLEVAMGIMGPITGGSDLKLYDPSCIFQHGVVDIGFGLAYAVSIVCGVFRPKVPVPDLGIWKWWKGGGRRVAVCLLFFLGLVGSASFCLLLSWLGAWVVGLVVREVLSSSKGFSKGEPTKFGTPFCPTSAWYAHAFPPPARCPGLPGTRP